MKTFDDKSSSNDTETSFKGNNSSISSSRPSSYENKQNNELTPKIESVLKSEAFSNSSRANELKKERASQKEPLSQNREVVKAPDSQKKPASHTNAACPTTVIENKNDKSGHQVQTSPPQIPPPSEATSQSKASDIQNKQLEEDDSPLNNESRMEATSKPQQSHSSLLGEKKKLEFFLGRGPPPAVEKSRALLEAEATPPPAVSVPLLKRSDSIKRQESVMKQFNPVMSQLKKETASRQAAIDSTLIISPESPTIARGKESFLGLGPKARVKMKWNDLIPQFKQNCVNGHNEIIVSAIILITNCTFAT